MVPVIGDGRTPVYPIHVEDVARAWWSWSRRPEPREKVLELGGERLTMDEVLRTIQEVLGKRRPLLHHPAGS